MYTANDFIDQGDKGILIPRKYPDHLGQGFFPRDNLSGAERSELFSAPSPLQIIPSHISPDKTLFPEADGIERIFIHDLQDFLAALVSIE
jgi:hypothetical protein